jgi:formylglycine-generating enzyme required for sulfatase activity
MKLILNRSTFLFVLSLLPMLTEHSGAQESAEIMTVEDIGLELLPIPAGSFMMGSPASEKDRLDNEGPQTEVTLTQDFWLGKTEVTQRQWEAIMGNNPSRFKGGNRPVERVNWEVAMEFCRKLTERERAAGRLLGGLKYTLPTEAQWEYACRAGATTRFSYGDDPDFEAIDEHAWYYQNSELQTHDVGEKLGNAWGLHDMHGNVVEWCLDWLTDGYPGGSVTDPSGPQSGMERVFRGGGWGNSAWHSRTAERGGDLLEIGWERHGLRVALVSRPKQIIADIGIELILIPAGTFKMGSPVGEVGRESDEGPQTEVSLSQDFWLGKTEVTQREWEAIMGDNPSSFKAVNRPVETVSWNEVIEFCRKLTERERVAGRLDEGYEYTLPTEAQWEYACRAGTVTQFSYGADPDFEALGDFAWYAGNSIGQTHVVGGKLANPWGLHDMHGNVWEFCLDWSSSSYPGGNVTDPRGPFSGSRRDVRGGSWSYAGGFCRSAERDGFGPNSRRDHNIGFRVALVPLSLFDPIRIDDIGMDLVSIPAGTFKMGSPDGEVGRESDEGPVTEVTISKAFWLGRTEVTRGQWETIMGNNPSQFNEVNRPVENVSWNRVMEFCRELTDRERSAGRLGESHEYTLPTEAQWEYACRAGTTTRFSHGDDPDFESLRDYGWYGDGSGRDGGGQTHEVGGLLANPWGLYDMHGNVNEMCLDWYSGSYHGESVIDPRGPTSGTHRVMRGGSWHLEPRQIRSAERRWVNPDHKWDFIGFRVALVPVS